MVTSELSIDSNRHLLFLLPGQSLSPRAFWDFQLPENRTHAEYFLEAGIDVIMFDPAGYGKSPEFYNYDRVDYADQIQLLMSFIDKEYESKRSKSLLKHKSFIDEEYTILDVVEGEGNKTGMVGSFVFQNKYEYHLLLIYLRVVYLYLVFP